MRELKIQNKYLLNMKVAVNYLNFVFHLEVKTKYWNQILNFVFQFIKVTKWHFQNTDSLTSSYIKLNRKYWENFDILIGLG